MNDNLKISSLILAGAGLIAWGTYSFHHAHSSKSTELVKQNNKSPLKKEIQDVAQKKKSAFPVQPIKYQYSVKDFEAKNLLNKKILTQVEYEEALGASKHVGISYQLPDPKLNYKITEKDLAHTRKIERAVLIANSHSKKEENNK